MPCNSAGKHSEVNRMADNDSELYDLKRQLELQTERLGAQVTETARWQGKYEAVKELYDQLIDIIQCQPEQIAPPIQLNTDLYPIEYPRGDF
jgi:hypothetical protein